MYSLLQRVYNYFYDTNKQIKKELDISTSVAEPYEVLNDKSRKIQAFLNIRHVKNIYYKYTDNPLFKQKLYDDFLKEADFDYGESAYDDDSTDVCIFDTYVCNYIENRKNFLDYLKNNEIKFVCYNTMSENHVTGIIQIQFIMDMKERDILDYYMTHNDKILDALFTAIITENNKTYTKNFR